MHTDSSASLTYFASVSASEWTTTVRMPISRQARWMRSAISPRLAIRILPNISAQDEKRLAVFHRLAVLDQDGFHHACGVGLDLVHQLHRFDDADGVALLHRVADFDERLGVGRGRAVERADHRRLDYMALLARRRVGWRTCGLRAAYGRGRRGGEERCRRHGCHARHADLPALDNLDLLL